MRLTHIYNQTREFDEAAGGTRLACTPAPDAQAFLLRALCLMPPLYFRSAFTVFTKFNSLIAIAASHLIWIEQNVTNISVIVNIK